MMRAKLIVLGALALVGCTELNVEPRPMDGSVPFDGPLDDLFDALGQAGFAGGGSAGATAGAGGGRSAGGAGGEGGSVQAAGGKAGSAGGAGGTTKSVGGAGGGGKGVGGAGGATKGAGGAGGAPKGAGGATASCPAGTANPCTPNMVDTVEEACCATGKRTQSRKCDPTTCQWGSFGAWSACSVQAECTPGAKSACTNSDPCGNRVCSNACTWGACVPKAADGCLCIRSGHTDCGSNYRCGTGSHDGQWQFCLKSSCE
ncbi:MAG TPA: hypothetical protein VHU40_13930, partial [Polyangia bacterium]|nr:hypothetical protein [Polyangia bacterium]